MSFVDSTSDLYSDPVTAVTYAISCYIGLCYNGIQLYIYCVGLSVLKDWEILYLWHESLVAESRIYSKLGRYSVTVVNS